MEDKLEFIEGRYTNSIQRTFEKYRGEVPELEKPEQLVSLYIGSDLWDRAIQFSDADTKVEVETLDKIFKKRGVKSVLDIACGTGRHSIPLSKLGYDVTGVDFALSQIALAKAKASMENLQINFFNMDANSLGFKGNSYDAAICMFSTLGEEPMNYPLVIRGAFSSLKPGGIFLTDNYNWALKNRKSEEHRGNIVLESGMRIERVMKTRFTDKYRVRETILTFNGTTQKYVCITHTLNTEQWIEQLRNAGFTEFEIYHDYEKAQKKDPGRIQILALKPQK